MKRLMALITCSMFMLALPVAAQTPPVAPPNTGTVLLMTGTAEIEVPNDEAVASFFYETQDADLTKAQALVNQRVGDGTAALKRADPKAQMFVLVGVLVLLPVILGYTVFNYWVFRGKVRAGEGYH